MYVSVCICVYMCVYRVYICMLVYVCVYIYMCVYRVCICMLVYVCVYCVSYMCTVCAHFSSNTVLTSEHIRHTDTQTHIFLPFFHV